MQALLLKSWENKGKYKNINVYVGEMDNNTCIDVADCKELRTTERGFFYNSVFIPFNNVLYVHAVNP